MDLISRIALLVLCPVITIGCSAMKIDELHKPFYRIDCDDLKNIASDKGAERISVKFTNFRDEALDIYWINYNGAEELKTTITPDETWHQITYVSHPWVLRQKSGECLAAYNSSSDIEINIR